MPPDDSSIEDERQRRAERLFLEAVDLPADERTRHIDHHCGDDPALADSVRRLLDASDKMGGFLERTRQSPDPPDLEENELHPTKIGRYEIVRAVGTGGMGTVYEARQDHPRRRVAVKIIHPALTSTQWLKRFQREAEVLGHLQHPSIATIHEAGEAEVLTPGRPSARQPFLAMEFIDGADLRSHVAAAKLDTRQRLELVARICDAMQHAHDRGIVHRDLKPSNILIDTAGQPKVLDFGIARATGSDWTAMTVATMTGQIIGTIPYMSPEQIGGKSEEVDARTDVYALGVILYELLSGRLPIETRDRSLPETMRAIREDEPSGLGSLDSAYRGDIDAIVGKALRKEPERRYAAVSDLGADIRRHLRGEPIRARPASASYQLRRFTRRNKALVGGVIATMVALALGLVFSIGFARRELRQRHVAESMSAQAARAAHAAQFTAAIASLDSLKPADAARSLDAVPEALRAWEWKHLRWRAGQHLVEIPPPDAGLPSVSLAQRSSLLFAADGEGTIRAWSLTTGAKVREFSTDGSTGSSPMAASPDGNVLLSTTRGRQLTAWDTRSGRELWRLAGQFSLGRELWRRPGGHLLGDDAYDADGSLVAVGAVGRRTILLLDPRTGEVRETIPVPDETAAYPNFSPDGSKLVYLTEAASGVVDRATRRTTRLPLGTAAFADGGETVIAHNGSEAVLVDLETGSQMAFPGVRPVEWPVGTALVAIGEPAVDAPHRRFLVPGEGSTVVRRLGDGTLTAHLGSPADPLGWSGDGKRVVTLDDSAVVRIWDAATDSRLSRIPAPPRRRNDVYAMAPGGRSFATASWRFVTLYDLDTGAERWNAYHLEPYLFALAFSPDGRRLAAGGKNGDVTILDAGTGAIARLLPVRAGEIGGLAWLPTGDSLLVASREGALRWIDAVTGDAMEELTLPGERFPCHGRVRPGPSFPCIDVSADGTRFAVAGEFPPEMEDVGAEEAVAGIALWDASDGRRLGLFHIDSGGIGGVALDSSGSSLAAIVTKRRYSSKGPDGVVVWDVASGDRIPGRTYEAVALQVISFTPEEDRIVLGGDDGKLRFLDFRGDLEDVVLDTDSQTVLSLSLSPDGSTMVAGAPGELVLLETGPPVGGFEARARAREAREVADALYRELVFSEDVAHRLREETDLPVEIQLAALDLVRIRGDHHGWLNSDATIGYRATSLSKDELHLVLRKSELAVRLWPGNADYVATRGKCKYRAERHLEALDDLDRAAEMHRASGGSLGPEDLAFIAMARWRLGEREVAGQTMRDLEAVLATLDGELSSGTRASIEEARTLTDTK